MRTPNAILAAVVGCLLIVAPAESQLTLTNKDVEKGEHSKIKIVGTRGPESARAHPSAPPGARTSRPSPDRQVRPLSATKEAEPESTVWSAEEEVRRMLQDISASPERYDSRFDSGSLSFRSGGTIRTKRLQPGLYCLVYATDERTRANQGGTLFWLNYATTEFSTSARVRLWGGLVNFRIWETQSVEFEIDFDGPHEMAKAQKHMAYRIVKIRGNKELVFNGISKGVIP